jgi:phosphoribosylamine--glycine ligase
MEEDRRSLHYGEVTMQGGELRTAGMIGYALVVTGVGATIEKARADVYERVDKVVIPNGRYRQDIGVKLMEKDWARLKALGWIG